MATNNSINNGTNSDNTTLLGLNAKTNLGSQLNNTGVGYNVFNASGNLINSCAFGVNALSSCTSGSSNTAIGAGSMQTVDSSAGFGYNVALGADSMGTALNPLESVAIGKAALYAIQSGNSDVAVGNGALSELTAGSFNSALGHASLANLVTGSDNTCAGKFSGASYNGSESGNIILGQINGTVGDNNTLRIGNASSGTPIASTFIEGISGVSVSGPSMVTISSSGQLGSQLISLNNYTHVTTTPYTVLTTDCFMGVATLSIGGVINLPDALTDAGQYFIIKDTDGGATGAPITVQTLSGIVTIDGAVFKTIAVDYGYLEVFWNGVEYSIYSAKLT